MNARNTWLRKPRPPIGEARRVTQRNEEGFYPAFEQLLNLHRLDYWHCTVAQASQPGYPDYTVWGAHWHAWIELKARQANGRAGTLSTAQKRYRASIEAGDGEYHTFLLPDQWDDVDVWLNGHTNKGIRGWGARQ